MFIKKLRVAAFRHIRDVELGPFDEPSAESDLIALVGPNGAGKTSILELIGRALSNTWDLAWQMSRSFPESSFELEFGLTAQELDYVQDQADPNDQSHQDALSYLLSTKSYARNYDFPTGTYVQDPELHNIAHAMVTEALRDRRHRAIGFFLRSDRAYPPQTFDRKKLLQHSDRAKPEHVMTYAFNNSAIQYQDMYDFLIEEQYRYRHSRGAYHISEDRGTLEPGATQPTDPMAPYDALLSRLFPGYSFTDMGRDTPNDLYVKLPSGDTVRFHDLSSGEKEVFFILAFFERVNVRDAMIVVDEPELHLHPELARLLVRTMQEIRPRNQVWLGTHSGEVVDECGQDRLFVLELDKSTRVASAIPATEESEARHLLRELFGYSGYIGVARAMVFIEGSAASVDRKIFAKLFSNTGGGVKVIPSGSSDALPRVNAAVLNILNSTLSSCEFFLIRDRDYLTDQEVSSIASDSAGRLWVLQRNQIENYLLDSELIAKVQSEIFNNPCTAKQADEALRKAAKMIAGESLRDMISFRMNRVFSPQDFSQDQMLKGVNCIDSNGVWVESKTAALKSRFSSNVESRVKEVDKAGSASAVDELFEDCKSEVLSAVNGEGWREVLPGKRLISEYARLQGLAGKQISPFTNMLVRELAGAPERLPTDLRRIIESIVPE